MPTGSLILGDVTTDLLCTALPLSAFLGNLLWRAYRAANRPNPFDNLDQPDLGPLAPGTDDLDTRACVARGIVLSVNPRPLSSSGSGLTRTEDRSVQIDIEIDGRDPVTVNAIATIPARFIADVLPGATVALFVCPNSLGAVTVTGPGVAVPAFGVARAAPPPA